MRRDFDISIFYAKNKSSKFFVIDYGWVVVENKQSRLADVKIDNSPLSSSSPILNPTNHSTSRGDF